jgi:hypothetical protein
VISTTIPTEPPILPSATIITPPIEDLLQTAQILLYEDIVANIEVRRYISVALDRLGLHYEDLGDAIGHLRDRMRTGAPNGKPWDLIIISAEDRGGIEGEFFQYMENSLNQGSAVILEAWYLDEIKDGTIKPILTSCGLEVAPYIGATGSSNDLILYPLIPNHPLLNEVISITDFKISDYYPYDELGNLMYLTGGGDGELIVGINKNTPNSDGVLAFCRGGQLILQTFSSHSYLEETMVPLWQNYIHSTLRIHFSR